MAKTPPIGVRCSFYVRTQLSDAPTYRFDALYPRAREDAVAIAHPPAIGDLIHLHADHPDVGHPGGTFRVVDRGWMHPDYGSAAWRPGEPHPDEPPLMQVILEVADGLFAGQVVEPDQLDEEDAADG